MLLGAIRSATDSQSGPLKWAKTLRHSHKNHVCVPLIDANIDRPDCQRRKGEICMSKLILTACIAAALLCGPAAAGARDQAKVIMPDNPQQLQTWSSWGFSDAIVTGDTVYLSGVVAGTKDGDSNLEAAYTRAFDRIGAILGKAGVSWDDVVDITSFHTDLKSQMPAIVAVKNKYVKAPFPAWTAIQVVRLIPDNGITEIKIVARVPRKSGLMPAKQ